MPFAYSLTAADVHQFWRDFEARQVAKRSIRTTIRKESRMLTKSVTDVAWAAVSAAAWELVQRKKAETFDAAVDQLKQQSHPTYLTYLASLAPGSTPPVTTPDDVVKRAEETAFQKKRQVMAEVSKRVDRLVKTGLAPEEAMREVFAKDRDLYNKHREASYASGPLPPVTHTAKEVPTGPVYAAIQKAALALKRDDPWGAHTGKSAAEMEAEVLRQDPGLYEAYRHEVTR